MICFQVKTYPKPFSFTWKFYTAQVKRGPSEEILGLVLLVSRSEISACQYQFLPRLRVSAQNIALFFFGRLFTRWITSQGEERAPRLLKYFCSLLDCFPLDLCLPAPCVWLKIRNRTSRNRLEILTSSPLWQWEMNRPHIQPRNWTLLFIIFTRQWGSASAEHRTDLRILSCFCKTS